MRQDRITINLEKSLEERISQGDIFCDIEITQHINDENIKELNFPYGLVMTQDCDLSEDNNCRLSGKNDDKILLSVIVVPLYNIEQFISGCHLQDFGMSMTSYHRNELPKFQTNEKPRYHYLVFSDESQLPDLIIDFKHYFTVCTEYLKDISAKNRIGKIPALFREQISHRFAFYLSRIGLPPDKQNDSKENENNSA